MFVELGHHQPMRYWLMAIATSDNRQRRSSINALERWLRMTHKRTVSLDIPSRLSYHVPHENPSIRCVVVGVVLGGGGVDGVGDLVARRRGRAAKSDLNVGVAPYLRKKYAGKEFDQPFPDKSRISPKNAWIFVIGFVALIVGVALLAVR
jgi:hypothetical protein